LTRRDFKEQDGHALITIITVLITAAKSKAEAHDRTQVTDHFPI
jgi:hypothetical protein